MNQAHSITKSGQPLRWSLVMLLLLFLLLTACFGGGDNTAEEAVPEAAVQLTGTLVCSESCLNLGQCGTAVDGRTVILARSLGAGLRDHDALLPNNDLITILAQEPHTIQDFSGIQTNMNFYAVQPFEGGFTNWVAGSCVELAAQQ